VFVVVLLLLIVFVWYCFDDAGLCALGCVAADNPQTVDIGKKMN
jgi:hypothetical protein